MWGWITSIPTHLKHRDEDMRILKIFIIVLILTNLTTYGFCDKLIIPFDCYPKQVQKEFKNAGYNLDLSAVDREKDSWGFLVSEGTQYVIYTYDNIDVNEFPILTEIIFKIKVKE